MSRNRYIRDYRLIEDIDRRGRIKTSYEYIGKAYFYENGFETAARSWRLALVCCAAGWAAFIGALYPVSNASKTLYISLPFAFAALPLGFMTATAIGQLDAKEPLEHRQADRIQSRCPVYSFLICLLAGIALVGEGVNLLRGTVALPGDGIFCLCAASLLICGIILHRRWKYLRCAARSDGT